MPRSLSMHTVVFLFKHGHDYGDVLCCNEHQPGDSLVVIRWNDHRQPRVGIGTEMPAATLMSPTAIKAASS